MTTTGTVSANESTATTSLKREYKESNSDRQQNGINNSNKRLATLDRLPELNSPVSSSTDNSVQEQSNDKSNHDHISAPIQSVVGDIASDETTDLPSPPSIHNKSSRAITARVEEYYNILDEYSDHFARTDSALVWLARAVPSRSNKLAVPKSCRHPKSSSGRGGYAAAFKSLNLTLRDSDTNSGHWHCWYYDPLTTDLHSLQVALTKRWKESDNYNPKAANIVANIHLVNKKNKLNSLSQQQSQSNPSAIQATVLPVSYVHYDGNPNAVHDRLTNMHYGSPSLYIQPLPHTTSPHSHSHTQQQPIPAITSLNYNSYQQQMIHQQQLLQQQHYQAQLANNALINNPYLYQQYIQQYNAQHALMKPTTDNSNKHEYGDKSVVPFTSTNIYGNNDAHKSMQVYGSQLLPPTPQSVSNPNPYSNGTLMNYSVSAVQPTINQNTTNTVPN